LPSLLRGIDIGHLDTIGPAVQSTADGMTIHAPNPNNGGNSPEPGSPHVMVQCLQAAGPVFLIQNDKIHSAKARGLNEGTVRGLAE
jgi:hypothetical protein